MTDDANNPVNNPRPDLGIGAMDLGRLRALSAVLAGAEAARLVRPQLQVSVIADADGVYAVLAADDAAGPA